MDGVVAAFELRVMKGVYGTACGYTASIHCLANIFDLEHYIAHVLCNYSADCYTARF
jgi:hypothetical protein